MGRRAASNLRVMNFRALRGGVGRAAGHQARPRSTGGAHRSATVASEPPGVAGTAPAPPRAPAGRRMEVLTVYAVGLFQGLSLVAVPAAATILTSPSGYDLSKSRYGLLFLPQVVMAILGSLALPTLSRRVGFKRVLLAGIVADPVAMSVCWWASNALRHDAVAFPDAPRCHRRSRPRLRAHARLRSAPMPARSCPIAVTWPSPR